jgi:hypothetical protein
MVADYYITNQKESAPVPYKNPIYDPTPLRGEKDTISAPMKSAIKKIKPEDFNKKFNRLFDDNMSKKVDLSRNAWFQSEEPIFDPSTIAPEGVTKQNMSHVLDKYKSKTAALVQYNGIRELGCGSQGSNLYDDDEEHTRDYVTSDPFSKLKYDDLRKVHKDQTVLAISERDLTNIPRYESTDHLARVRSAQSIIPLEQQEAARMIAEREESYRKKMLERQHQSRLDSLEYEKKSKAVAASFLHLTY